MIHSVGCFWLVASIQGRCFLHGELIQDALAFELDIVEHDTKRSGESDI